MRIIAGDDGRCSLVATLSLALRASSRQRERKVVERMTGVEPYLDNDAKALNINVFRSSELYP